MLPPLGSQTPIVLGLQGCGQPASRPGGAGQSLEITTVIPSPKSQAPRRWPLSLAWRLRTAGSQGPLPQTPESGWVIRAAGPQPLPLWPFPSPDPGDSDERRLGQWPGLCRFPQSPPLSQARRRPGAGAAPQPGAVARGRGILVRPTPPPSSLPGRAVFGGSQRSLRLPSRVEAQGRAQPGRALLPALLLRLLRPPLPLPPPPSPSPPGLRPRLPLPSPLPLRHLL